MDADEIVAAPTQIRQRLWCEGGTAFATVINNRWLEIVCRNKRCRKDGVSTVHIWDLQTGRRSTEYRDKPSAG